MEEPPMGFVRCIKCDGTGIDPDMKLNLHGETRREVSNGKTDCPDCDGKGIVYTNTKS